MLVLFRSVKRIYLFRVLVGWSLYYLLAGCYVVFLCLFRFLGLLGFVIFEFFWRLGGVYYGFFILGFEFIGFRGDCLGWVEVYGFVLGLLCFDV